MKKNILGFSILVSSVIFSVVVISTAVAQDNSTSSDAFSNITYPITELGNCKDRDDCKIYCDDSANTVACVNYAEEHSLLSEADLKIAKNFIASGSKGPGNCNGKKECQTYCDDRSHIDECVSYAEKNGLMSDQELQNAKKVQSAIKKGVKFPSCNTKKECDAYCEDSNHMEECLTFAQEAGLLSDQELQNSQKVLTAIKQGVKSPACKGKDACDIYCAEASHAEECVNFAVAAGIVTSDEARIIKETGGKGPGGCKNKSECDSYCGNEANRETCMSFAKEHNIPQPQPPQQPSQGGGQNNPNPVTCIEDCESTGRSCISKVDNGQKQVCDDNNRNCNENCNRNVCQDVDGVPHNVAACNSCFSQCVASGASCWDKAVAENSACTTTKDVCVGQCQKSSKPTKPTKPTQPNQPSQPGQGGGTPSGGLQKSANPTKCIAECETTGKNCISVLAVETEACRSKGEYCRTVYCETYGVVVGNRPTEAQYHFCSDTVCTPAEKLCYKPITEKDSACRTKEDVCVMDCQISSKPSQPSGPGPTFSQPGPGGCKTVAECQVYCQSHPEAQAECQAFKASQKPAPPSGPGSL